MEPVIGLEVHVQLRTVTKLFCGDLTVPGAQPNTRVCPVCLGLPGALPVLNAAAVDLALRAALALGCTVHERSVFDRKTYFYPDLPKGYQITQSAQPLATRGEFLGVRIARVHLEEDAGRLFHDRFEGLTAIDLDRAGIPLIEIVTEPDLRTPADTRRFLVELKRLLLYLDVSDCEMENGSLRVDANVSLRGHGGEADARAELKNLNSFAHLEHALVAQLERQRTALSAGASIEPETLAWDAARGVLQRLRRKERRSEYRYQPDPDLPPIAVDAERITRIRNALPELPQAKQRRFAAAYDLPRYDIDVLTSDAALADYFEAVAVHVRPKAAGNWIMTEVLGWLNRHASRVQDLPVPPERLARLIGMVERGRVSRPAARRVFAEMAETGCTPEDVVAAQGLEQISDPDRIAALIDRAIAGYPDEVSRYHAGEAKVMQFLMGQVMQSSGGRADPRVTSELLRARLEG
ncbi:MAG TPA: Asp-tRNA(Asn)/Glu-tRNA(Gln) amidotransferase subunit GatB [Longimicrobiales bacterium]